MTMTITMMDAIGIIYAHLMFLILFMFFMLLMFHKHASKQRQRDNETTTTTIKHIHLYRRNINSRDNSCHLLPITPWHSLIHPWLVSNHLIYRSVIMISWMAFFLILKSAMYGFSHTIPTRVDVVHIPAYLISDSFTWVPLRLNCLHGTALCSAI